jgi:hypothetical protein
MLLKFVLAFLTALTVCNALNCALESDCPVNSVCWNSQCLGIEGAVCNATFPCASDYLCANLTQYPADNFGPRCQHTASNAFHKKPYNAVMLAGVDEQYAVSCNSSHTFPIIESLRMYFSPHQVYCSNGWFTVFKFVPYVDLRWYKGFAFI